MRGSLRGTWKDPTPSSEGVSSHPCSKTLPHFEALYLSSAPLRHRAVNKLLGRDARETVAARRCLLCAGTKKRRYRKLQIRSHFTATNMTGTAPQHCLSSTTHSLSVASNEQEQRTQVCVAARSRRLLPSIGWGKLQQKPVQIRRDGFVIRLKCRRLREALPGRRSRIDGLNFQLFPSNRCHRKTIIGTLRCARDRC